MAAAASSLMLCVLVVLATDAPIPTVPISYLASLDEGAFVQTVGLVADLWSWDDGTQNILLVDTSSSCTIKVVCVRGIHSLPGDYVHLGDEVRVSGEVFGEPSARTLHADSDHVSLLRPSRFVLTVDALAGCWHLFEGDSIEVRGILVRATAGGDYALRGLATDVRMALEIHGEVNQLMLGEEAVVAGTLAFNSACMAVVMDVDSLQSLR
jgi:hypothetical protein